jgi:TRAP-type C4-dicarboxylate transport system permease small subunit
MRGQAGGIKLMNVFDKIIGKTVQYSTYIGTFALAAVMMIIVANVILRVFGGIIAGTYDLVETITVLVASFALVNTEYERKHTVVDMLTTLLKQRTQLWLDQFNNCISFAYWITIAYATIRVTIDKAVIGERTDLLKVSIIPFRGIWSFALVLMAVLVIYNVYRNFRELRRIEP